MMMVKELKDMTYEELKEAWMQTWDAEIGTEGHEEYKACLAELKDRYPEAYNDWFWATEVRDLDLLLEIEDEHPELAPAKEKVYISDEAKARIMEEAELRYWNSSVPCIIREILNRVS